MWSTKVGVGWREATGSPAPHSYTQLKPLSLCVHTHCSRGMQLGAWLHTLFWSMVSTNLKWQMLIDLFQHQKFVKWSFVVALSIVEGLQTQHIHTQWALDFTAPIVVHSWNPYACPLLNALTRSHTQRCRCVVVLFHPKKRKQIHIRNKWVMACWLFTPYTYMYVQEKHVPRV